MIQLRSADIHDAPNLARIMTATNRDTFQGLVPERCLSSPTLEKSIRNWRRALGPGGLGEGRFLLVAEEWAGEVVGYALAGGKVAGNDAERELNVLMVSTPWQRRGIGRMLVTQVAMTLKERGVKSLLVGILKENPNQAFYERLGARRFGTRPFIWAGYETEEVLYRWENIDAAIIPTNSPAPGMKGER